VIRTSFKNREGMPIQPAGAGGMQGTVVMFQEFTEGLADLEGFSHIILLYHFHQSTDTSLRVTPFMDSQPRGLFSTRAPNRPNSIGISVVKLIKIKESTLHVENVDIIDKTPLLDIKPYVPEFDHYPADRIGWLEKTRGGVREKRSDNRFE
jgi:tRNA (adenine37-N6)-methyltransferase